MEKWKCKKTELILDTPVFKVRKDLVQLPSGKTMDWTYWDSRDSAMIVGITKDKKLILIEQYRYLVGKTVIEFPAGGLNGSENIKVGAKREFREETGYECNFLVKLGSFYETYGQLNRKIHIFFAKVQGKASQKRENPEHERTRVKFVTFKEAVNFALTNKFQSTPNAAAILLLKEKINKREIIV